MLIKLQTLVFFAFCYILANQATVVVNGGQITLNGAVTNTQIDIMVNYTANVKWLGIIFAKDQVNTDIHILQVDEGNAANPVKVNDCYLDQNGNIIHDDVKNIQPSITSFTSSIVPYGLKVAYNRDLFTGDLQDKRFYPNDVIQVCFMSSLNQFQGQGYQSGNQKVCAFMSLHKAPDYFQDRLLGNYATTTLFGGGNLTVYASQTTDEGAPESWLFLGIVHKQQGLTPYSGKWIGITYEDSLSETDMTLIDYNYRDFTTQVHILDMYITDSTLAKEDLDYVTNQGGDDIIQNLGALDASQYMVAQYKRKFSTGDVNRDNVITAGNNTFCFILGDNLAFTTFVQIERVCLNFNLTTSYLSYFRINQQLEDKNIQYVEPQNDVQVIKVEDGEYIVYLRVSLLFLLIVFVN